MKIHIAQNLKDLRVGMNLTQNQLAIKIGVTKSTISAYENGTRLPSYDVLIKLAAFFHVSTDNILGFSNEYVIEVSELTIPQRNTIQEIIDLYKITNK